MSVIPNYFPYLLELLYLRVVEWIFRSRILKPEAIAKSQFLKLSAKNAAECLADQSSPDRPVTEGHNQISLATATCMDL